ncbi:MAG: phosphate ABC transporter substrate-binding protein PstS [Candidatus Dormiibacterota bacterium]|jgi:phosphate transport system substrate-binding protein
MNVRRHAAIGSAVLTGAFLVAACGSTSTPTTSSPASTATGTPTAAAVQTGNPTSAVTLTEDGSSLLYPYLQKLQSGITAAYPNITLSAAAGGSGKGQTDAISGAVTMGGSDAYLSPGQVTANPGLLNVPIAVSAQAVNYNLAGISNLKLSGDVIAQMYEGTITTWNDSKIAALNPGVTLPATPIVPVRRVDSSGDTFIFTSFLSATNTTWANGPAFGTTVNWPSVSSELTANGNPAMVDTCHSTPGCIAYVGVSVESTALVDGLGEVELENASGAFVQPNETTINAAVTAGATNVPASLAQSLIYESGAQAYPIVNFEYLIIKSTQSSTDTALAIRTFLEWAISTTGGATSDNLSAVNFVPLPTNVLPKVNAAIAMITG